MVAGVLVSLMISYAGYWIVYARQFSIPKEQIYWKLSQQMSNCTESKTHQNTDQILACSVGGHLDAIHFTTPINNRDDLLLMNGLSKTQLLIFPVEGGRLVFNRSRTGDVLIFDESHQKSYVWDSGNPVVLPWNPFSVQ